MSRDYQIELQALELEIKELSVVANATRDKLNDAKLRRLSIYREWISEATGKQV